MARQRPKWPLVLLALPAAVAIWAGWVGLGQMTGFGEVQLLPGIWDGLRLNTAITLPIGMEAYAAYALGESLRRDVPARAKRFARHSAMTALAIGCLGQITFHLMQAAGMTAAPWPITMLVSCLPVGVLGMGAALYHLLDDTDDHTTDTQRDTTPRTPTASVPAPSPRPPSTPTSLGAPLRPPFQAVPNLTTIRPDPVAGDQSSPAPAGRLAAGPVGCPEPSATGRPAEQPADRLPPAPTGRPDPGAAERPADRSASRPDTSADTVPATRPARARRPGKRRGRAKTEEQLVAAVRELAARNGGAAPSQYQVRQALGVGGGRAARLVAAYQPPTPTAPSSTGTATTSEEASQ